MIRPAGLFDGTTVTSYSLAPRRLPGRFTSRVDLADALVRAATEGRHVGEAVDLVTTEGAPTFARMFLAEALHLGR